MTEFLINRYAISISGHPDTLWDAASIGQARMRCFRAYQEAYPCSMRSFLKRCRVRKVIDPHPDFGREITVDGRAAFYVFGGRDKVEYVRPGQTRIEVCAPARMAWMAVDDGRASAQHTPDSRQIRAGQ